MFLISVSAVIVGIGFAFELDEFSIIAPESTAFKFPVKKYFVSTPDQMIILRKIVYAFEWDRALGYK